MERQQAPGRGAIWFRWHAILRMRHVPPKQFRVVWLRRSFLAVGFVAKLFLKRLLLGFVQLRNANPDLPLGVLNVPSVWVLRQLAQRTINGLSQSILHPRTYGVPK